MQNYVVTGGYDKTVRLWDVRTGSLLRTFSGHKSSVSRVIFNPLGNLVISGYALRSLRYLISLSSGELPGLFVRQIKGCHFRCTIGFDYAMYAHFVSLFALR